MRLHDYPQGAPMTDCPNCQASLTVAGYTILHVDGSRTDGKVCGCCGWYLETTTPAEENHGHE